MFFGRYDAGEKLASKLIDYKDTDAVVYALPRGGVLVGFEVAKALSLPLDIVVTRKVEHPINNKCAVCAITENGERVLDEIGVCAVETEWIELEAKEQQKEAHQRRVVYKGSKESVSAKGKTAILVDDGMTTGLRMKAAIRDLEKQEPEKIVIAVPVAPHDEVIAVRHLVDEVVVLADEQQFRGAVGAYYTHFPEVFDKEVQVALSHIQTTYNERATV